MAFDEDKTLLVPEFREIVKNSKYGWNFLQYLFLFCGRVPFGNMIETHRDEKVDNIIKNYPYKPSGNRVTKGFYLDKLFKPAMLSYEEIHPDPLYAIHQSYAKDLREFIVLKDNINKEKKEEMGLFFAYIDTISKLTPLLKKAEEDLRIHVKKSSGIIGLDQLDIST